MDDDLLKDLREQIAENAISIAVLHSELQSNRDAVTVALASKGELDKERNNIVQALRDVIFECVRKPDYDKRHDEVVAKQEKDYKDMLDRINVERDFRNRILGIGLLVGIIWPIIVAFLAAWLKKP